VVSQAVKALALALGLLDNEGIRIVCVPQFVDVEIEGQVRTAIRMVIEPRWVPDTCSLHPPRRPTKGSMADTLTISRTEGRVQVLHLAGRLTVNTEPEFISQVSALRAAGIGRIVVDLGGVEMLTSAGLRAIHAALLLFTPHSEVEAFQKANPSQQFKSPSFKLAAASPQVHSILNMAGFLHTIAIYPDLQQALDSFPGE